VIASALGALGVAQLKFSQDHLKWFPRDDSIRRGIEFVDSSFAGSMTAEILVDTGIDGGVYEPGFLARLSRAAAHIEGLRREDGIAAGKAISVVDIIEETHQALNENDPRFRVIPDRRDAVAQELLLFENTGAEDLMDFIDSRSREARISLRVTHGDAIAYVGFLEELQRSLDFTLGDDVQITLTGLMTLLTDGLSAIVTSTARSYMIAFAAILPTLLIMIGNLQRGLLSVVPNVLPVLVVLGVMGWAGIGIDASTLMVGGIVLGLAVDDTMHLFQTYERSFHESGDVRRSITRTIETTGLAIVTTSLVLSAGFMSFGFAYMNNVSTLGFLLALATLVALVADLFLVPALLVLICRNEIRESVSASAPELEHGAWARIPLVSTAAAVNPANPAENMTEVVQAESRPPTT
jgi:predicted RND superfamily exporter protein